MLYDFLAFNQDEMKKVTNKVEFNTDSCKILILFK